jgi:hypothetical protein
VKKGSCDPFSNNLLHSSTKQHTQLSGSSEGPKNCSAKTFDHQGKIPYNLVMRELNLKYGDPLTLVLAADARLGPTSYTDDQIWELSLQEGAPPAIAVQTTFGLRARAFRIFPRFQEGLQASSDPVDFARQPTVRKIFPNYICLDYAPFIDLDVQAEYWVPQSNCLAGRFQLHNLQAQSRQIQVELIGQLTPTEGERMASLEFQAAPILSGATGNIFPVIFLTGGSRAETGSYPALRQTIEILPGETVSLVWAHAALNSVQESFQMARQTAARNWDAERARIELVNGGMLEIYTGESDWDIALSLAQKVAFSSLIGSDQNLPHPSYVLNRLPDQGYSLRGDGSDYSHLWNGQSPLEAWYLCEMILPSSPELAEGLLINFLAVQTEDGTIDWKPGLGGQSSHLMATPVLADLALRIYETTENQGFLRQVFPGLLKFVQAWFLPEHDRDQDGIPEWDHPMQSGSEDHPIFSHWHDWAQGVDIEYTESPALGGFLFQECIALMRMAEIVDRKEVIPSLQSLSEHLASTVEASWNEADTTYYDWDRDTHLTPQGEWLAEREGPGELIINRSFDEPVRLLIHIESDSTSGRHPQIYIHGTSASGHRRVEQIDENRFKWYLQRGRLTGERVYSNLERLEILGLEPGDKIDVHTTGYNCFNQSLLVPLWAGIPSDKRANRLIKKTITAPKKFWRPFGIPACTPIPAIPDAQVCSSIHLLWNGLVGEALLRYGYHEQAAELVSRNMQAVIQALKQGHSFRRYYHADEGHGSGERNAFTGVAPISLFLKVLGVRIISPFRVALNGFNPYPWPVTVKYRGLTVLCQQDKTTVVFPDGQTVPIKDPKPQIVSLDMQRI